MFVHGLKDWPRFHWNREGLAELLAVVARFESARGCSGSVNEKNAVITEPVDSAGAHDRTHH
jgi:hypothetical protein